MPVVAALATFNAAVAQCDSLIANAHQEIDGVAILPEQDRRQITVAGFLNLYIAWETFLEEVAANLLSGAPTVNGGQPAKIASPATAGEAKKMLIGVNNYFDYGNHQKFSRMMSIYFDQGVPFQPHLNGIQGKLDDLRTMRNSSAHISSSTQIGLETLALRLLGTPSPAIGLYDLLTAADPTSPGSTIYQTNRDLLSITATLIATG